MDKSARARRSSAKPKQTQEEKRRKKALEWASKHGFSVDGEASNESECISDADSRASQQESKYSHGAGSDDAPAMEEMYPHSRASSQENEDEAASRKSSYGAADEAASRKSSYDAGSDYASSMELSSMTSQDGGHSPVSDSETDHREVGGSILQRQEMDVKSEYFRLITASFAEQGFPPVMYNDSASPIHFTMWALPGLKGIAQEASSSGGSRRRRCPKLDFKTWYTPGVALVMEEGSMSTRAIWFCRCDPDQAHVWRQIEALHMAPGACASLIDVDCPHVDYLRTLILHHPSFTVEDVVMTTPMHQQEDNTGDLSVPPARAHFYTCPL